MYVCKCLVGSCVCIYVCEYASEYLHGAFGNHIYVGLHTAIEMYIAITEYILYIYI